MGKVNGEKQYMNRKKLEKRRQCLKEMMKWIQENGVIYMDTLINEAVQNRSDTWGIMLCEKPEWTIEKYIEAKNQRWAWEGKLK